MEVILRMFAARLVFEQANFSSKNSDSLSRTVY